LILESSDNVDIYNKTISNYNVKNTNNVKNYKCNIIETDNNNNNNNFKNNNLSSKNKTSPNKNVEPVSKRPKISSEASLTVKLIYFTLNLIL
jgi:hypothetical protein